MPYHDNRRSRQPGRGRLVLAAALLAAAAGSLRAGDGPAIYQAQCAACHGPDGRGLTREGKRLGAHDLAESRIPDAEIARRITEGTKDATGRVRMPAFRDQLDDAEIRDLVLAVKAFREARP